MTDKKTYPSAFGGLPSQETLHTGRAIFTEAYAFLPASTMSDIVTSNLPHWNDTRLWVLARPLSGFAETFSLYLMEVAPGGGSKAPEPDEQAEGVIFVTAGSAELTLKGKTHQISAGSYIYLAAGDEWQFSNTDAEDLVFYWFRKRYQAADGIEKPASFVSHDDNVEPIPMPDTQGKWATSRFVDSDDVRHDMHVNIVTFQPGGVIPFEETHVMEHGIAVLQGKAVYKLNTDWVEVEAGDFMWLRAFCPQACYAAGSEPFRYLLYKDVNRHPDLQL